MIHLSTIISFLEALKNGGYSTIKLSTVIAFLKVLMESKYTVQGAIDQMILFKSGVRDGRLADACIILIDES
jgi:hypothetical protein